MQHNNDLAMTPEQLARLQAEADHAAHVKAYIATRKPQDVSAGLYTLFSNQAIRLMFVNYLDLKSANELQFVSKSFHEALNKNNQEMLFKAAENHLPEYVYTANWKMIEKLVNHNPDLIFKKFKLNILGQEMETSVLDYACYVRDKYTLNICKKALRPDQKERYSEIVLSYSIAGEIPTRSDIEEEPGCLTFIDMVGGWLNGVISIEDLRNYLIQQTLLLSQEQGIYCLQPFYWVCQAVKDLHQMNYDISTDKLNIFMNKIDGFAKRYLLLRHMRKQIQAHEQNDGRYSWLMGAEFDEPDYPVDCRVRSYHANVELFIDPDSDDIPDFIFGEDYSLKRGVFPDAGTVSVSTGTVWHWFHDYALFMHLDLVRRRDFIQEQQSLTPEPVHLGNFPILPFDDDLEEDLKRLQP